MVGLRRIHKTKRSTRSVQTDAEPAQPLSPLSTQTNPMPAKVPPIERPDSVAAAKDAFEEFKKNLRRKTKAVITCPIVYGTVIAGGLYYLICSSYALYYDKMVYEGYLKRVHSMGMRTFGEAAAERQAKEEAEKPKPKTLIATELTGVPIYTHPPVIRGQEMKSWTTIPKDSIVRIEGDVGKTGWKRVAIECGSGEHEGQFATGYVQTSTVHYSLPGAPLVPVVDSQPQPNYWQKMKHEKTVEVKRALGLLPTYSYPTQP